VDTSGNLTWNTFLGGNGGDYGFAIAVDQTDNIYAVGDSDATWDNPVRGYSAGLETFVGKLDSNGNLNWNTFLGGSGVDEGYGVDTDSSGEIYVAGYSTTSWGNPIRTYTALQDAYVAELDPNGNMAMNTFLGGSGYDYGYGIDVQGGGEVYVTGSSTATWGKPVSAYTPPTDAFVAKLGTPPLVVSTSLSAVMNPGPSNFTVTFNENINNPAGDTNTDDATNLNNYLLINKGANATADTTSCAGGLASDDIRITVTGVTYDQTTYKSRVTLSGALPAGNYRLFVCGTTSIVDLSHTALAGDGINSGTDYIFDLAINKTQALPATGFAPNVITKLNQQSANQMYSSLGSLWLEIPSLNLKTNIVGVPKTNGAWNVDWLSNDTGWLNGTAYPTWNGNSVITGHVTNANGLPGPFANIKKLKYGDQIIIHMFGEKYIFEVQTSSMVSPSNTKPVLEHLEGHPFLTLITCQGYNPITDSYAFRRVVRAVLVSVNSE
jgi:LPXTG-site transpeptidase (sortase) family protein